MNATSDVIYFENCYSGYPTQKLVELLLKKELSREALQGIKNLLIREMGSMARAIQNCSYSVDYLIEILLTNNFEGILEVREGITDTLKSKSVDFKKIIEREYQKSGNIKLTLNKISVVDNTKNYTGKLYITDKNIIFIPESAEEILSPGEAAAFSIGALGVLLHGLFVNKVKPSTQKKKIFQLPLTLQAKYIKGSLRVGLDSISDINVAARVAIKAKRDNKWICHFGYQKEDKEKIIEVLSEMGIVVTEKGFFQVLMRR